MSKSDIIERMAIEAGITQKAANKAIKVLLEFITEKIANGEKVSILNFGVFGVKERKEKMGVHPKTREAIKIKATKAPYFKASSKLKKAVNLPD